jgi:hypothetical protein
MNNFWDSPFDGLEMSILEYLENCYEVKQYHACYKFIEALEALLRSEAIAPADGAFQTLELLKSALRHREKSLGHANQDIRESLLAASRKNGEEND